MMSGCCVSKMSGAYYKYCYNKLPPMAVFRLIY